MAERHCAVMSVVLGRVLGRRRRRLVSAMSRIDVRLRRRLLVALVMALVMRTVVVVAACERRPYRQHCDGYCQSFHFIPFFVLFKASLSC